MADEQENSPATQQATPEKVVEPKPEIKPEVKAKSFAPVLLKGEIKIFPDKPLAKYNQGNIKAYAAQTKAGAQAYAMLCEKQIVPQTEIVHKYTGIETAHLPKLVGGGVVEWSADFKEHFVFVYEDKLGSAVSYNKNPNALGLKPDLVISTIFRNLLEVIRAMRDKGIAHGNIRVSNLYDGGTPTYESAMLGEMLSAPSGYSQPALYETISRGLCHPLAKGPAEISDDIYALGVTLASLIRTVDVAEGMSDEDIINGKMEVGSFNFIVGKSRFPAPVIEFLRGTLNDDAELRWTFDDIMTWAEGRRVNAKPAAIGSTLKASRPLDFMRHKFLKPQTFGVHIHKDPVQAVPLVENGELYLWINRSIQDKELEKRYEDAAAAAKIDVGQTNYADRLSCFMGIAMGPENPIFYKDLKFSPMGFGTLLADSIQTKKELAPFVDVIQSSFVSFWGKCSPLQHEGVGDCINRMGNCQRFLMQTMMGSGIERCVYYLAPMAPCYSEKLEQFYIRTAEDYLNALEKISESKNRPEWFLDRHIIAFLSVRDKSVIEPFLPDLSSTEKHRQRQGAVKMMAAIQTRDKMGALPGLSVWISGLLEPAIDRFHDREKRKRIREQLDKIKGQGNLQKIAAFFDSFEEVQMDMKNYTETMRHYQALKKEYIILEDQLLNNKSFGMEAGRHAAALISGLISAAVVVIYLVFAISRGGGKIF